MIRALAVVLWVAACSPEPSEGHCELGTSTAAVQAADRKIIGAGAVYQADGTLRGRDDELRRSQRARREVAWQIVERALTPVRLAELSAQIPAWQSWYGKDDLDRVFKHLYEGLGAELRKARARFTDAALDEAFGWNVTAVEELDTWPEDRWLDYLAQFDSPEVVASVGGFAPIAYSQSAARHMLSSYPEILGCLEGGSPAPFVDTPGAVTRRALREPVALARCSDRTFGPYFVARDEILSAVLEAQTDAEVAVRGDTGTSCRTPAGTPCEAAGPGVFYVEVFSQTAALDGILEIDYGEATPAWAACLESGFPLDSVVIKAAWRRAQFGLQLPTYDTSAQRLAQVLDVEGDADWGPGQGEADPGPELIYTLRTPGGNTYRFAALHIITKELDHWTWITLWWSPDPDSDFGADRPASIEGVWRNYKMCVATSYDEADPDPTGGFSGSLGAALAATHGGLGAPSWCSNPYLEVGHGNADTNCIGCHQHGFTGTRVEDILDDAAAFPAHGRTSLRNNFPADYSWAVDAGDHLGVLFADVVDYYDSFE